MSDPGLKELFLQKAQLLSSVTVSVGSFDEALAYAVKVCEGKEACQLISPGCDLPLSGNAQGLCDQKQQKVLAAPQFDPEHLARLTTLCAEQGMACIQSGMRDRLAGIDVGMCQALWGIAETGTCVIESFTGVFMSVGLVGFLHARWNTQSSLAKSMSDSAFAVYVFHSPILIAIRTVVVLLRITAVMTSPMRFFSASMLSM